MREGSEKKESVYERGVTGGKSQYTRVGDTE